ncbi:MAG: DegT/DnrJ/EryC1/StrS family aminotransferase, partial [Nitrospinota bacterium]
LTLILASLNKPGEVIVPGFAFPAVANAVVWSGLKPVFVDVDPIYGNIDPLQVERVFTKKTVAILPVCNYGFPADFDKLEKISKKYHIPLIVDSAQSFGTLYKGKKCGGFGDAEVFSLSPSKIITSAEGGVVTTNNKKIADFVRNGRNYGKADNELFQFAGLSCRLSEFHSIIGLETLKKIREILKSRRGIARKYYDDLKECSGITLPVLADNMKPSFNFFVVYIQSRQFKNMRDRVLKDLHANGIEARNLFSPPVYEHLAFKQYIHSGFQLKVCEKLASRCITLPLYPGMSHKDVARVCKVIKKSL